MDYKKLLTAQVSHGRAALAASHAKASQSSEEPINGKDAKAAAFATALASVVALPNSSLALVSSDDDEGFDLRILLILAAPGLALTWALFNVWRVAFRQTVRLGEGISGSSKQGL